jgi:peptidoglycan/xylan/chitin deacetylase (PgdA/CDA1 family)
MKLIKQLYYSASSVIPTSLLLKAAAKPALFPYHHLVSDEDVLHVKHLYSYKNIQQFTNDLEHLLKYLSPVSLSDIREAVHKKKKLPSNSFLLSFDDGFSEVYSVIAPILTAKGIPAVFFINPAFIDNQHFFYRCKLSLIIHELLKKEKHGTVLSACRSTLSISQTGSLPELIDAVKKINNLNEHLADSLAQTLEISFDEYLREKKPFLTTNQLHELNAKGFAIGAHSWDHPYYDLISDKEKLQQTNSSMNFVSESFHPDIKTFSFPHFDTNLSQSVLTKLKQETEIELFFGIQNQKEELNNRMIHRFNAERPDLPLQKQFNGVLLLLMIQRLTGRSSVKRKL